MSHKYAIKLISSRLKRLAKPLASIQAELARDRNAELLALRSDLATNAELRNKDIITEDEYNEFMHECSVIEKHLVKSMKPNNMKKLYDKRDKLLNELDGLKGSLSRLR